MQKNKFSFCFILLVSLFVSHSTNAQKLEYELLYKIELTVDTAIDLGKTPLGPRVIARITGGTFEGPKLKGKVLASGGDWLLRLDSTTVKLDVRILLETEDRELIYNTYTGFIHQNPDKTDYWKIVPIFETSSKKYGWLNYTIAVGVGRDIKGGVAYDVYAIK
jgi:Protein of unknown function (DUF3237)